MTWPGKPARCTCARVVVPTLAETLGCPYGWRWDSRFGWLHILPGRPS